MERNPEVPDSTRDEALFHYPKTVEARKAPPKSTVSRLLRGTLRSSLRSPAQVEGTQGYLPHPEKDLESSSSKPLEARFPYHDSRAMRNSPSPRPWRPDFRGTTGDSLSSPSYLVRNPNPALHLEKTHEMPLSSRDEDLHFLHGLESNPESSLQSPQEA